MSKKKSTNARREFLKNTALGAGGAIGLATVSGAGNVSQPVSLEVAPPPDIVSQSSCDVVVVGGGVSGTYAALRLALVDTAASSVSDFERKQAPGPVVPQPPRKDSPISKYLQATGKTKLDVKLFEYSGRIGGRLLSTPIEGVDGPENGPLRFAEFGGFRFDRQMKIVWETAQALGLSDEPFYYQDINIETNNIVNVRGNLYTNGGNTPPGKKSPDSDRHKAWLSYPNLSQREKNLLNAGFDLGNYITNLTFIDTLPGISSTSDPGQFPDITSIEDGTNGGPYPAVTITLTHGTSKAKVTIPGIETASGASPTANGWSLAYVRYHFAFNVGNWDMVKEISDMYESAKRKTKVDGRSFFDWSWWALKRHYLTQEAVAFLEDASGYNEEGNSGTVETNIDENFYFSVKSDGESLRALTDYSDTDHESAPTAWRHIKEGYSAIPQQLFGKLKDLDQVKGTNKSENVVKQQLVSFTKEDTADDKPPQYCCLFYKRVQGPDRSVSGSAALNLYFQSLIDINLKGTSSEELKKKKDAEEALKRFQFVTCSFLVLALPRRSLELINQNNFFFGSRGVETLLRNSVHDILAMRMFVAYPRPWWLGKEPYTVLPYKNDPLDQSDYYPVGRTRTDLGLRQLYYWCYNRSATPDGNGNYADPQKPAVMLASYVSGDATRYWRALQDGQPYDQLSGSQLPQAHLYNKAAGKPNPGQNIRNPQAGGPRHGSITMGAEAHKQIMELHQVGATDDIPLPYYVHFEDWSKDPWGAGWHSWRSGFAKYEQIPKIRKPIDDENIFIIGECYSNVQGWVQGALNAAEAMCQCNLGLPWASWLSVDGIWLGQGTSWVQSTPGAPDPNPCIDEDKQFTEQ